MLPLVLVLLAACAPQQSASAPELALETAFFGPEGTARKGEAFTLLAGDADGDGDPDLLVNWHVFGPPRLLWNQGKVFASDARPWSLPEHPEAALLDAPRRAQIEAVRAHPGAGMALWHSDNKAAWSFLLRGPLPAEGGTLVVETNRPITGVLGVAPEGFQLPDERTLRVPLSAALVDVPLLVTTKEVGIQFRARLEGLALPFFLGPELAEHAGPLDLWYRDPHGMAWHDATGDGRPDLYVTRGALGGRLVPPDAPKHDDLYLGASEGLVRAEVPGDYGRGRAVQWVDLEGDGRDELYVSAKSGANRLLRLDPETRALRDEAPLLGLDFRDADAFAWLDLDGDGDDDLVTLDARHALRAFQSEGGRRFEPLDPAALGFTLAPQEDLSEAPDDEETLEGPADVTRGIDHHDLVVLDVDDDGDLDLLVSGWGAEGRCFLYRRVEERFVDASRDAGLAELRGVTQLVVVDLDADAWLDLLVLGREPRLLWNRAGTLRPIPLAAEWAAFAAVVGAPLDADGDGALDVALAGRSLALARNRSAQAGGWVSFELRRGGRVPLGAEVRARYADGRVQVHRLGTSQRGHLSQSHGPLLLASPRAAPLRTLELRVPGLAPRTVEVSGPGPLRLELD